MRLREHAPVPVIRSLDRGLLRPSVAPAGAEGKSNRAPTRGGFAVNVFFRTHRSAVLYFGYYLAALLRFVAHAE